MLAWRLERSRKNNSSMSVEGSQIYTAFYCPIFIVYNRAFKMSRFYESITNILRQDSA